MNDYLLNLIQKYKWKGLLIDTNIVLLYLVGSIDASKIRGFSRTAMFTEDDFYRVTKFIEFFEVKITTPHILTEVSDLIGNSDDLHLLLKGYIDESKEIFLDSATVSKNTFFTEFGLADTAIIETALNSYLVVTNDNSLFGFLLNKKIDAVNLDQIRMI